MIFSRRIARLRSSPIRETLALIDRPQMISFAGGLPSPQTYPAIDFNELPARLLGYGQTEGEPELRERISEELQSLGRDCSPGQVLILSGSQQGIDLVSKLFIDPGTNVAIESPTYLAALQVFETFGARLSLIDPGSSETLSQAGIPAFAYLNPTFQNPSGHCYTRVERETIAKWCDQKGIVLFEDDPYRDLVYGPCERTPVSALLRKAPWIYQGSFSKTLFPGLRLGFLAASSEIISHLIRLKQGADLHSNRPGQWFVLNQLKDSSRQVRLLRIQDFYRQRRDAFSENLTASFGDFATWNHPLGGLFFWIKLNAPVDSRRVLEQSIRSGVAFMPGEHFFPEGQERLGLLRLNFSYVSEDEARKGLHILGELLKEYF